MTFDIADTSKARYMEAFGISGEFAWKVSALDASGNQLCTSDLFTFSLPAANGNPSSGDGGGSSYNDCQAWGTCNDSGGNQ